MAEIVLDGRELTSMEEVHALFIRALALPEHYGPGTPRSASAAGKPWRTVWAGGAGRWCASSAGRRRRIPA